MLINTHTVSIHMPCTLGLDITHTTAARYSWSRPHVFELIYTRGLTFYSQFSNPARMHSSGRFAVSSCKCMAFTLETELHKLEKRCSNGLQIFYGSLFSVNASGTNNTAMRVHYSSKQLGACGCWWIFDERMDPLPGQVEYSVHTQSHTWAHTHTSIHVCTHTPGGTVSLPLYAKQVPVKVILEYSA